MINLYVAALYLPESVTSVDDLLSDKPRKLLFRYLRDFEGKLLIDKADEVMGKNPEINLTYLKSRLDQINRAYDGGVKEGDVYELEYDPHRGTTLIRNGKEFTTIPGLDFAKAYFGIWLSKYPMSEDLRDSLLEKLSK